MDMFHHRQEVFVALDGVAIGQADVQEWQLPWSKQTSLQRKYTIHGCYYGHHSY